MNKRLLIPLIAIAVSLAVNGWLFWHFERNASPPHPGLTKPFDAVWWWVVTSSTVGYGDIVPRTTAGRLVGVATILAGFFIYTTFIAVIVEAVHGYVERRERGTLQVKAKGHIVLCEYTSVADELLNALPNIPRLSGRPVVVVSDLVYSNPDPRHFFVSGVPVNPRVMKRANLPEAAYIFVFANLRFSDPDMKTLHIARRARVLNPSAVLFLEMLDPMHPLLRYVGGQVVAMDSRKLMEMIVRGEQIDPWRCGVGSNPDVAAVESREA
jgi:hypothetical protein